MPTYLYECQSCGRRLETEQSIRDEPLTDCPCGAPEALVRLIQPPAVLFKGSGFYVTDYAPSCSGEPES